MDLQKLNKERTYIGKIRPEDDGKKVIIVGWLYDSRALGKIRFVLLRDISGEIQVTAVKGESSSEVFGLMDKSSRESVVIVKGIVKKSEKAPGKRNYSREF